jgi:hypothetical protein
MIAATLYTIAALALANAAWLALRPAATRATARIVKAAKARRCAITFAS